MTTLQANIKTQLNKIQSYVQQLNDYEKYAWGGEGLGLLLIIAGIILLF